MLRDVLLLIGSLLALTLAAELLVRGAARLALRLGLSTFFVGLTIVGFGTSTPELATSVFAAIEGRGDLAVGNVVGSNVFNVALILGLTALLRPIPIRVAQVRQDVWTVVLVSTLPFVGLLTGNVLTRGFGLAMLAGLVAYVVLGYRRGRHEGARERAEERELEREVKAEIRGWRGRPLGNVVYVLAGLVGLVLGSSLLVDSASAIARRLGMSELVIGLTIVAAGTSAPELVTSVVAMARRHADISVGNILGSNVFNLLGILGLTCAITPQDIQARTFRFDLPVMLACAIALLPFMRTGARLSRLEGATLLLGYVAYTWVLLTEGTPG